MHNFIIDLTQFNSIIFDDKAASAIELFGSVIVAPLFTVRLLVTSKFAVCTKSAVVVVNPERDIVPKTDIITIV